MGQDFRRNWKKTTGKGDQPCIGRQDTSAAFGYANMGVYEVVLFQGTLSGRERVGLQNYFNQKGAYSGLQFSC